MDKANKKHEIKMHLVVLVVAVIAILIGAKSVDIKGITIVFSPLIWAMLISFAIYMTKKNILTEKDAPQANAMMGIMLAILIAKLGVTSGGQIDAIKKAGLALVLQNFGNLGTIIIALPIALLL